MSVTWDMEGSRRASMMSPHQDVLGFIHPGGQIRRPAKIWMKFLHQIAVRPGNVGRRSAALKTEDFISFILGNSSRAAATRRAAAPRVSVRIACRTPSGKTAVQIRL